MNIFKLALLQIDGTRLDVKANTAKATRFCQEAARKGAHLAVFPEMYNIAYPDIIDEPRQYWHEKMVIVRPFILTHQLHFRQMLLKECLLLTMISIK